MSMIYDTANNLEAIYNPKMKNVFLFYIKGNLPLCEENISMTNYIVSPRFFLIFAGKKK